MARARPDGHPALTPYLMVRNAAAAIDFYRQAFGARERMRLDAPGGRVGHAELEIGESLIMLADEPPAPSGRSRVATGRSACISSLTTSMQWRAGP
jgi:PhnB protein